MPSTGLFVNATSGLHLTQNTGRIESMRWRATAAVLLIWSGLFVIASLALDRIGAFQGEFDGNPDESAHMITGMLVRDYLVSGTSLSAMEYAERQYIAYPKVAFGVWPPLFHLVAGVWFLFLEPTRASAILLMAAMLSLTAVIAFAASRHELGDRKACVIAVFTVLWPATISQFGVVIADALLMPLTLAATIAFARFLETRALRYSVWFGVFSALSFLTKYNAFLLIFVPLIAIALTRQWSLWRNPRLWAAPALVILLAGPWYVRHIGMVWYAADIGPRGFMSRSSAALDNFTGLMSFIGPLGCLLFAVGLWSQLISQKRPSAHAATQAALLVGVWGMHSVLYPDVCARYLLPALPALLYFLCAGFHPTAILLRPVFASRYTARGLAVASVTLMLGAWPHEKSPRGWRDLTSRLRELATTKVLMVSGDGASEGAMIAEMALHDPQRERSPQWTVLRSSKMLANSTWMAANYKLRFNVPEELLLSLKKWGVSVVAIDVADPQPHEQLLLAALQRPGSWREVSSPMAEVRIFLDTKPPQTQLDPIDIDLTYTLGRTLRRDPASIEPISPLKR